MNKISIVLPAKNEGASLSNLLPKLVSLFPKFEIIVVDDGSTDNTREVCKTNRVKIVSHSYAMGNGAAIKSGARACEGDIIVFMDADGQHQPEDVEILLNKFDQGYEMVVGARNFKSHSSTARFAANTLFNKFASVMTGFNITDLTSGFRVVRARHFKKFLYLLPNGFSYPTTITMAFFRSGLPVTYVPITTQKRIGKSKINLIKERLAKEREARKLEMDKLAKGFEETNSGLRYKILQKGNSFSMNLKIMRSFSVFTLPLAVLQI